MGGIRAAHFFCYVIQTDFQGIVLGGVAQDFGRIAWEISNGLLSIKLERNT